MFHYKDGWFFERQEDGSVLVLKRKNSNEKSRTVAKGIIPADEWASIVSSVSLGGETTNYYRYRHLHKCPTPNTCLSRKMSVHEEE